MVPAGQSPSPEVQEAGSRRRAYKGLRDPPEPRFGALFGAPLGGVEISPCLSPVPGPP